MERVLYAQNPNKYDEDYIVINGAICTDDLSYKKVNNLLNKPWKKVHETKELKIRSFENAIYIESHFNEKDKSDRYIYFIYFIDFNYTKTDIIKHLLNDAQLIEKSLPIDLLDKLFERLNSKRILKVINVIITAILFSVVGYFIYNLIFTKK